MTTEQFVDTINNNVKNAERVNALSPQMLEVSESGNVTMEKLITAVDEMIAASSKIEELSLTIAAIGDKTKVIDEIVFQTKLLSFNASVEAERAAEHGRGFSVVAQEVGSLAQLSGKAAVDISVIVAESIKNAKEVSELNIETMNRGNILVQEAAKIFESIVEKSTSATELTEEILMASKEQSAGIKLISESIEELDKGIVQNSQISDNVDALSQNLGAGALTLEGTTNELCKDLVGCERKVVDPSKTNCWTYKKCGREPGGAKTSEFGVCPASTDESYSGNNGGKNGGRYCWKVAETLCGGSVQGGFSEKLKNCLNCEFFQDVKQQETESFIA